MIDTNKDDVGLVAKLMQTEVWDTVKRIAFSISAVVYVGGLLYAGVRSYSLLVETLDPTFVMLALVGIVALELTAIGLPLAIHFWTAPGMQRWFAIGFYVLDLGSLVFNSYLDAGRHSGANIAPLMQVYGDWGVPSMPILCMLGWAVIWKLDPVAQERDTILRVRAATHKALLAQIIKAVGSVDVTEAVRAAAEQSATVLVRETLAEAPGVKERTEAQADFPVRRPPNRRNGELDRTGLVISSLDRTSPKV